MLFNKGQRKSLLINTRFQLSFIGYTVAIAVVMSAIYFSAFNYFVTKFRQEGINLGLTTNHPFYKFIETQFSLLNQLLLVSTSLTLLFVIGYSLIMSNKIAGPLYNLNKSMREVLSNKKIAEVRFRKNDYFLELADNFNQILKNHNLIAASSDSEKSKQS